MATSGEAGAATTAGRDALQATLRAIDAKDWQGAGEAALRGVASPLRAAGEALATLLEGFAAPGDDALAWRDDVVRALDGAVPAVLDAALVLYANVLFHRLVHPREEPLMELDVPSNAAVEAIASAELARDGAAVATERHADAAARSAAKLVEATVTVAELWSACGDDSGKLDGFYGASEGAAAQMLATAKTLRVAAAVLRRR